MPDCVVEVVCFHTKKYCRYYTICRCSIVLAGCAHQTTLLRAYFAKYNSRQIFRLYGSTSNHFWLVLLLEAEVLPPGQKGNFVLVQLPHSDVFSHWVVSSIVIRWLAGYHTFIEVLGINFSTQIFKESLKALWFRKDSWTSSPIFSSVCGSGFMVSWSVTEDGLCAGKRALIVGIWISKTWTPLLTFKSHTCKFALHPNRPVPSDERFFFPRQGDLNWPVPPRKQL